MSHLKQVFDRKDDIHKSLPVLCDCMTMLLPTVVKYMYFNHVISYICTIHVFILTVPERFENVHFHDTNTVQFW